MDRNASNDAWFRGPAWIRHREPNYCPEKRRSNAWKKLHPFRKFKNKATQVIYLCRRYSSGEKVRGAKDGDGGRSPFPSHQRHRGSRAARRRQPYGVGVAPMSFRRRDDRIKMRGTRNLWCALRQATYMIISPSDTTVPSLMTNGGPNGRAQRPLEVCHRMGRHWGNRRS
jgi:hypothetical protein